MESRSNPFDQILKATDTSSRHLAFKEYGNDTFSADSTTNYKTRAQILNGSEDEVSGLISRLKELVGNFDESLILDAKNEQLISRRSSESDRDYQLLKTFDAASDRVDGGADGSEEARPRSFRSDFTAMMKRGSRYSLGVNRFSMSSTPNMLRELSSNIHKSSSSSEVLSASLRFKSLPQTDKPKKESKHGNTFLEFCTIGMKSAVMEGKEDIAMSRFQPVEIGEVFPLEKEPQVPSITSFCLPDGVAIRPINYLQFQHYVRRARQHYGYQVMQFENEKKEVIYACCIVAHVFLPIVTHVSAEGRSANNLSMSSIQSNKFYQQVLQLATWVRVSNTIKKYWRAYVARRTELIQTRIQAKWLENISRRNSMEPSNDSGSPHYDAGTGSSSFTAGTMKTSLDGQQRYVRDSTGSYDTYSMNGSKSRSFFNPFWGKKPKRIKDTQSVQLSPMKSSTSASSSRPPTARNGDDSGYPPKQSPLRESTYSYSAHTVAGISPLLRGEDGAALLTDSALPAVAEGKKHHTFSVKTMKNLFRMTRKKKKTSSFSSDADDQTSDVAADFTKDRAMSSSSDVPRDRRFHIGPQELRDLTALQQSGSLNFSTSMDFMSPDAQASAGRSNRTPSILVRNRSDSNASLIPSAAPTFSTTANSFDQYDFEESSGAGNKKRFSKRSRQPLVIAEESFQRLEGVEGSTPLLPSDTPAGVLHPPLTPMLNQLGVTRVRSNSDSSISLSPHKATKRAPIEFMFQKSVALLTQKSYCILSDKPWHIFFFRLLEEVIQQENQEAIAQIQEALKDTALLKYINRKSPSKADARGMRSSFANGEHKKTASFYTGDTQFGYDRASVIDSRSRFLAYFQSFQLNNTAVERVLTRNRVQSAYGPAGGSAWWSELKDGASGKRNSWSGLTINNAYNLDFGTSLCDLQTWTTLVLVRTLPMELITKILAMLLLETSLLVVGENAWYVTTVTTAFSLLLRPFRWEGVYVPLLPKAAYTALEAPCPIIVGMVEKAIPDGVSVSPNTAIIYIDDFLFHSEKYIPGTTEDIRRHRKFTFATAMEQERQTSANFNMASYKFFQAPTAEDLGSNQRAMHGSADDATDIYLRLLKDLRVRTVVRELQYCAHVIEQEYEVLDSDSLHRHTPQYIFTHNNATIARVMCRVLTIFYQFNEMWCELILQAADGWKFCTAFNDKTGLVEFVPELYMSSLHDRAKFQEHLIHTQMFVSYVDKQRVAYNSKQRSRQFIADWLYYRWRRRHHGAAVNRRMS